MASESPSVAEAIVRRIETVAALVARHPAIGRPTTIKGVRVFSVLPYPYLVFYEARDERGEVIVLRVRHTAGRDNWREGR